LLPGTGVRVCMCVVCWWLIGIDGGEDVNREILVGIYDRTSRTPFKPAADHVTQVMKVEQMIVGKKPVSPQFHFRFCWHVSRNVCDSRIAKTAANLFCSLYGWMNSGFVEEVRYRPLSACYCCWLRSRVPPLLWQHHWVNLWLMLTGLDAKTYFCWLIAGVGGATSSPGLLLSPVWGRRPKQAWTKHWTAPARGLSFQRHVDGMCMAWSALLGNMYISFWSLHSYLFSYWNPHVL